MLHDLFGIEGVLNADRPGLANPVFATALDIAAGFDIEVLRAGLSHEVCRVANSPALDDARWVKAACWPANLEKAVAFAWFARTVPAPRAFRG